MRLSVITTTTTANVEVKGEQLQIKFDSQGLVECKKDKYLEVYQNLIQQEVVPAPKIVNLTPHEVMFYVGDEILTFKPHHTAARVDQSTDTLNIGGIPVKRIMDQRVLGLPPEVPGTLYIVSGRVFEIALDRADLIAPDTTLDNAVKDANGRTIGVRQFFTRI